MKLVKNTSAAENKFSVVPESGKFLLNEIYYSIQGEGSLAGTPMVFVRFSKCNLRCNIAKHGFNCDTEFESGNNFEIQGILDKVNSLNPQKGWILLTGGEPSLQLNQSLIDSFKADGWKLAIETNGTKLLPEGLDWICVSPKSAEHTIKQLQADEVKYVRRAGMGIPQTKIKAKHFLISVPFQSDGSVLQEDLDWCLNLVKNNPEWKLSLQSHKLIGVR